MKLVKDEVPHIIQCIEQTFNSAKKGEIRALAMVYMKGDDIYTDYVKGDGTTLTEMIGCVEIMRTELVEAMRK